MKLASLASKTNNKGNHIILRGQESAKRRGANYRSIGNPCFTFTFLSNLVRLILITLRETNQ